ncbi:hypothetical protein [Dyadobacter sp. CY343]|uniref:hypothetical protein n=1 Tax=Dyadobacter sp. CY343 TaxID=2907299 RepID=UPI00286E729B|nr:hypothetical protein [Dyadobacter sp. CY343]
MNSNQDSLHTLHEIRDLMERSSKFLSLSGLSGVFAGIFALIGAGAAYLRYKTDWFAEILSPLGAYHGTSREGLIGFLFADGLIVLILSLTVGIIMSVRKGKKRGLTLWNGSSKRLLVSMLIPLGTGGVFCLAMLHYGFIWLVFPATLLFYGLALVNASRFTYPELFYLGMSEIAIGCLALFMTGYSLVFWAIGFGVLHIVYGLTMYNKYDREKSGGKQTFVKCLLVLILFGSASQVKSQLAQDSVTRQAVKWYDRETIYLRGGNSFVKNNVVYSGQRALAKEFLVSERGLNLYLKSRRIRSIGLVISLAGSAGSVISLLSGSRDNWKTFFWVSVGTGVVSSIMTVQANSLRDEAVWTRNRDAMQFMQAN